MRIQHRAILWDACALAAMQAIEIARFTPELVMIASLNDAAHQGRVADADVDVIRVIARLGNCEPIAQAMEGLRAFRI